MISRMTADNILVNNIGFIACDMACTDKKKSHSAAFKLKANNISVNYKIM